VVATDYVGVGNETDLVLSANAYTKMAQPGGEKVLVAYGKVDVEYERVSCQYPGKTLMLKVLEDSRYNSYLSMQFLYQAGSADINAVQVFEVLYTTNSAFLLSLSGRFIRFGYRFFYI